MTKPAPTLLAAALSPLVLLAWFLWPWLPFEHTAGGVIRYLLLAYALFFLARFLASAVTAALPQESLALWFALVFVFAAAVSLSVSIGFAIALPARYPWNLDDDARAAALDAVWCTVAAGLAHVLPRLSAIRSAPG